MYLEELSDRDFQHLSALVYEKCGINLHEGKKELVRARLGKRLRQGGFQNFKVYYKYLTEGDHRGNELVQMLDAISTNLTSFFREENHFDFLREKVFPTYHRTGSEKIRFWSAGCSSGEEPYSLAIYLLEYFGPSVLTNAKILATDLSTKVLALAQRGVYPKERIGKIPRPMIQKYFQRGVGAQEGNVKVKDAIRNIIQFKRLNLMHAFPFREAFQVVFCRNVMIYFDKKTQQDLVQKYHECLKDKGFLFIGHSESLAGIDRGFRYVMPSIYQKI